MSTLWSRPSASEPLSRIAHPLHTVVFLLIQGILVARGLAHANQLRAAGSSNISMYVRTIVTDWLMLAFILGGVWLAKAPLTTVIGQRWRSALDVFRDVGIGIVFIILQQLVLSVLTGHVHSAEAERAIQFLLPHGRREMALWLALSITAGICEEAIFRGLSATPVLGSHPEHSGWDSSVCGAVWRRPRISGIPSGSRDRP